MVNNKIAMKLINHKKDNAYTIDTFVMNGTITMTYKEYVKVMKYLTETYEEAVKEVNTFVRDSLTHAIIPQHKDLFSFGVLATKLIAIHYHLKGYKSQNYGIQIL